MWHVWLSFFRRRFAEILSAQEQGMPPTEVQERVVGTASQLERIWRRWKVPLPLARLLQTKGNNQGILRDALRHNLDFPIAPVVKVEGVFDGQHTLTNTEMKAVYERRRAHMEGYRRTLKWAVSRCKSIEAAPPPDANLAVVACPPDSKLMEAACPPTLYTPLRAIAFWHSPISLLTLPESFVLGLASALRVGFVVDLYVYETFPNVPRGVAVHGAFKFLTKECRDDALQRGVPIQLLADYVRAKAALATGGWVVDGDCVWLRRPEQPSLLDTQTVGHFFGSLPCWPGSLRKSKADLTVHWMVEYLKSPGDALYLATPWAFPAASPLLRSFISELDKTVGECGLPFGGGYNHSMETMQRLIRLHGLEGAIQGDDICSGIPPHKSKASLDADKVHLFDIPGIQKTAVCLNNFWQSTKGVPAAELLLQGASSRVEPGSAWDQLTMARPKKRAREKTSLSFATTAKGKRCIGNGGLSPGDGGLSPRDAVPPPAMEKSELWPASDHVEQYFPSMGSFEAMQLRYHLDERIGGGIYGEVFAATCASHKDRVAVKVVRETYDGSIVLEPHLLALCAGPHVVRILDAWVSPCYTVIVMPLIRETLYDHIDRLGGVSPSHAFAIGLQIAEGLSSIHSKRVMHRDLHLNNMLMEGDEVVLADFGLAAWAHDDFTGSANVYQIGLRPPEILFAHGSHMRGGRFVCARQASYGLPADVWAFACLLYFLVSRKPAFGCDSKNELSHAIALISTLGMPSLATAQVRRHWFDSTTSLQLQSMIKQRRPLASGIRKLDDVASSCLRYWPEERSGIKLVIDQLGGPCPACHARQSQR